MQHQQEATALRDAQFMASVHKLLDNVDCSRPGARRACNDVVLALTHLFDPCKGSFLQLLPQGPSTALFTYLDVRSHKRLGATCKRHHAISVLPHSWCLRMRALGLIYGCHVEDKCDWKRAESLLVTFIDAAAAAATTATDGARRGSVSEKATAQSILGLLYMEQASWRRTRGAVLYDRALDLWHQAAAGGDVLALVWPLVADRLFWRHVDRRTWHGKHEMDATRRSHLESVHAQLMTSVETSDDALDLYAMYKLDKLIDRQGMLPPERKEGCNRFLTMSAHLGFALGHVELDAARASSQPSGHLVELRFPPALWRASTIGRSFVPLAFEGASFRMAHDAAEAGLVSAICDVGCEFLRARYSTNRDQDHLNECDRKAKEYLDRAVALGHDLFGEGEKA